MQVTTFSTMPIYAYKCDSCGFAKDVLQKLSDAPLSDCPSCSAPAFQKQLTAAGFQLKGSGWYATDFKGGGNAAAPSEDAGSGAGESKPDAKPDAKGDGKSEAKPAGGSEIKKPDAVAKKPDAPARTDSGA